jgi:ribosomal protein S18 acetylase RimI-like enzyme
MTIFPIIFSDRDIVKKLTALFWFDILFTKESVLKNNNVVIRDITDDTLETSLAVIRTSFATVAKDFSLTPQNCPTHTAFITMEQLNLLKENGSKFFGLFTGNQQIGFVGVESTNNKTYDIELLAVLPEYRHKGYGEKLVSHIINYVKSHHGKILSLGMMNENTVLKNWYLGLGFKKTSIQRFEHLPFTVCVMDLKIKS